MYFVSGMKRLGTGMASVALAGGLVTTPAAAAEAPIAATKANADEIHMKARGKSCPDDFTLAKAKGTHKVTWQYKKRIGEKTLKKGKLACIYTGKDGVSQSGKFDENGVLVALPSNFPKNPTPVDIAALGLTPETKVSPDLRLPTPKLGSELAPAVLPEEVKVISVNHDIVVEEHRPAFYQDTWNEETQQIEKNTLIAPARVQRYKAVEVQYHGGEGTIMTTWGYDPATNSRKMTAHELSPDKVTTVYQLQSVNESGLFEDPERPGEGVFFTAHGFIAPDYGQAKVPASMIQGWDIYTRRALQHGQDPDSTSFSVGKWATPNRRLWNEKQDGYAQINPDGFVNRLLD